MGACEIGKILIDRIPKDVDPCRTAIVSLIQRDSTGLLPYLKTHPITAADMAPYIKTTWSDECTRLANEVIQKTKWFTHVYRPGMAGRIREMQIISDVLVPIVLAFMFY